MAADCKKGLVFIIAWMTTRKYFVSWASDIVPWNETPCHVVANPVVIAGDFGVDTGVTSLPAVFTPAHNTPDIRHVFCIKADQGSSWIPFAAVYGAIVSTWSKKRKQNQKFIYKRAHKGMHRRFFRSLSLPDRCLPNGHQYWRFLTFLVYYFLFLFFVIVTGPNIYLLGHQWYVLWFTLCNREEFSHTAYYIIRRSS